MSEFQVLDWNVLISEAIYERRFDEAWSTLQTVLATEPLRPDSSIGETPLMEWFCHIQWLEEKLAFEKRREVAMKAVENVELPYVLRHNWAKAAEAAAAEAAADALEDECTLDVSTARPPLRAEPITEAPHLPTTTMECPPRVVPSATTPVSEKVNVGATYVRLDELEAEWAPPTNWMPPNVECPWAAEDLQGPVWAKRAPLWKCAVRWAARCFGKRR